MYTATRIPKTQGGLIRRGFEASTDIISSLLTQMTRARRNYYWDREKRIASERGTRPSSLYQIRKRQVGRVMQSGDDKDAKKKKDDKPSDAGQTI
jgi:hypothetical protein